jgi:hypothetical protein
LGAGVIASVHIANVGARAALGVLRKAPEPASVKGLRHADVALTAPLRGSQSALPDFGRVGLIAFWDDDAAVDRFLAEHPLARTLAGGWRVRLEPLRVSGTWPGVPDDLSRSRASAHAGPAAVLTLGRLRLTQTVRFVRASGRAERRVVASPGLVWASGLARPPFVATCSLWDSVDALSAYAYGTTETAHPGAIAAHAAKPFHHQSAFIRFRPYASEGGLAGRNPLADSWLQDAASRH